MSVTPTLTLMPAGIPLPILPPEWPGVKGMQSQGAGLLSQSSANQIPLPFLRPPKDTNLKSKPLTVAKEAVKPGIWMLFPGLIALFAGFQARRSLRFSSPAGIAAAATGAALAATGLHVTSRILDAQWAKWEQKKPSQSKGNSVVREVFRPSSLLLNFGLLGSFIGWDMLQHKRASGRIGITLWNTVLNLGFMAFNTYGDIVRGARKYDLRHQLEGSPVTPVPLPPTGKTLGVG